MYAFAVRAADDPLEQRLRQARPGVESIDGSTPVTLTADSLLAGRAQGARIGRFELFCKLGEGGMGCVYKAHDTRGGETVALKILRKRDPRSLTLLKREFRSLAGVHHENLVRFYELHVSEGDSYFTMELVPGRDFMNYVWDCDNADALRDRSPDFERIRNALRQLVAGLSALHNAGKVHRDLKPSNVLVSSAGRVTVLDFGLMSTHDNSTSLDSTFAGVAVGTPLYMSPEQLALKALSSASDWYAVGGMLYHALVGSAPCEGLSLPELRRRKSRRLTLAPSELRADVPDDLDRLTCDLLDPNPAARPTGEQVLARIGAPAARIRSTSTAHADPSRTQLVGREAQLAELDRLLALAKDTSVLVMVTGATGVGKTALVSHFVATARARGVLTLTSRCHEHESIPYKILDGVVDAIVNHLRRMPIHAAACIMPRFVHELSQLFPALQRVEAVAQAPRPPFRTTDKHELRLRAAAALRELLARISDQRKLLVWVDDMQWGDGDSLGMLKEILGSKHGPRGLFIGTYTGPADDAVPMHARILSLAQRNGAAVSGARIEVSPLSVEEATALASSILPDHQPPLCAEIAREAGGNPLLIRRFASYVRGKGGITAPFETDAFDAMIRHQVAALSGCARELVRAIALAGSPIEQRVAAAAAAVDAGIPAALAELTASGLIRTESSGDRGHVEIDHGRVALAVTSELAPSVLADLHTRLARALLSTGCTDHQRVARHLRDGGQRAQAVRYLRSAADQAAAGLAFDRAARLYRELLTCGVEEDERAQVETALGDALRNAGLAREAAAAYLRAEQCSGLRAAERFELKRRAAQELLFSGRYDLAQDLVTALLRALDVKLPQGRWRAIAGLLFQRALLAVRGLRYTPRAQVDVPAGEAARSDTFWMLGQGLIIIDPVRGNCVLHRNVASSLRCGDAVRVSRALSFEAASLAWSGVRAKPRAERLLRVARETSERAADANAQAVVAMCSAASALFVGEPSRGLREAREADRQLRACHAGGWEIHTCKLAAIHCAMQLGLFQEYVAISTEALDEALACGNLFRSVGLRNYTHLAKLVLDDAQGARAEVEAVGRDWPYRGFDMQHLIWVAGPARIQLYEGAGVAAYETMRAVWPRLSNSMMLRARLVFMEAVSLRGRGAALAYAQQRKRLFRRAALRDARMLMRHPAFGSVPAALMIRASVAASDGQIRRAQLLLAEAETAYEHIDAPTIAAIARYQRGVLWGGEFGRTLVRSSEQELRNNGIRCPEAFVQMYTAFPRERSA
jgi:serine/threonine protein kinase